MNYCLMCDDSFFVPVSWRYALGLAEEMLLCEHCSSSFQVIEGEICHICGRPFSLFPEEYRQGNECSDCIRWEKDELWKGILMKNRSLYVYNDFLKELVSQLKYRGDAELLKGFRQRINKLYRQEYRKAVIVPVPLSEERHYERGFNQAELLAKLVDGKIEMMLERVLHEKKQSKKSRKERLQMSEITFKVKEEISITGKDIVLVDDVYTTGATVRQCAKVLKEAGALTVSSMTLGR